MVKNLSLSWKLGVAIVSLMAAVAVYSFARIHPPELLAPFQALNAEFASNRYLLGNAPSFFYTLSLGLLIGVCASSRVNAISHCLIWIGLALFLEMSQHPFVAESISIWTRTGLPDSNWTLIVPYWAWGVFDPLDLLATMMGGAIALYLLTRLPLEKGNLVICKRRLRQLVLSVVYALGIFGIVASGGNGGSDDEYDRNPEYLEIELDRESITSPTASLYGDVFDDYANGFLQFSCYFYITNYSLPPPTVVVSWSNSGTGEQGNALVDWEPVGLGGSCGTVWRLEDVALAFGDNDFKIHASTPSGRWAEKEIVVTRLPAAPAEFIVESGIDDIILEWSDVNDATSYVLYYWRSGIESFEDAIRIQYVTSPYLVTGLDYGSYQFMIRAIGDGIEGVSSTVKAGFAALEDNAIFYIPKYPPSSEDLSISLDIDQNLHVFHRERPGDQNRNNIETYASNSTGRWISSTQSSFGKYPSWYPYAALDTDPSGVPHIVFIDSPGSLNTAYLDENWIIETIESGRNYADPDIAVDSDGSLHVVYFADLILVYATNESGAWITTEINTDSQDWYQWNRRFSLADIELDSADNVHIAYVTQDPLTDLRYATNSSGDWTHTVVYNEREVQNAEMEIDGLDQVHIVFSNGRLLSYAKYDSGRWITEHTDGLVGFYRYGLAVDSSSKMHVITGIRANYNPRLHYATNKPGEWVFSDMFSLENVGSVDIDIDTSDRIHTVYTVDRYARYFIFDP